MQQKQQPARRRSPGTAGGGWAAAAGTVDEASMERSKSFVTALQVRAPLAFLTFPCRSGRLGS